MDIRMLSSKLDELKERKKALKLEYARGIQKVDAQIRELHEKRARVVSKHKAAADSLDREIAELARQAKRAPAVKTTENNSNLREQRPRAASAAPVDVGTAILDILKTRSDISESLLREKLRTRGLSLGGLGKELDKMVANGVIRRRARDYSLAKRR